MQDERQAATAEVETVAEILTVPEIARTLRVPRSWVYTNAAALGGIKVGKYVRFTRSAIEAYLLAHRV